MDRTMLFNEDYSVESVKAIVTEFIGTGKFDERECTIRCEDKAYPNGSYAHPVVKDVWMRYNGLLCPSWDITDARGDKPVYYSLHPNRSTKSILWKVDVSDGKRGHTMLVIAPTRRMARLEATNGLYGGEWGPRRVDRVECLSQVDSETIPSWMRSIG